MVKIALEKKGQGKDKSEAQRRKKETVKDDTKMSQRPVTKQICSGREKKNS